jgi:nitrite reductase/ring-hydroxylating ferredoxin subunit
MDRKEFIKSCGAACLKGALLTTLLQSCRTSHVMNKAIIGSDLIVPLTDFQYKKDEQIYYKKHIIIQNDNLQYPICVYRFNETKYSAILMKCSHQGAELVVFGDKLECPAHGSEFSNMGVVQSAPADTNLRTFPVTIESNQIKISLKA